MKRAMIALVGASVTGLVAVAAPAAAAPVTNKTLTANRLYKAGALPTTACPEKPIKKLDAKSAKSYLNAVRACLDHTWAAYFKKAGLKWSKPKVVYATKAPAKFCGDKWGDHQSGSYCYGSRTMLMVLGKDLLEDPEDLFLMNLQASLHGEHVQNLAGITGALNRLTYRNKAEFAEQNRRYNLQNLCLAGAYAASVWKSLDRGREDWDDLLYYLRDWAGKNNGSRKSITYWTGVGFRSARPGSCNTWTAPSARVT